MASAIPDDIGAPVKRSDIAVDAASRDEGSDGSARSSVARIVASRPLPATKLLYASLVRWKPSGTGKPQPASRASDAPLPPTFSRVARGSAKESVNSCVIVQPPAKAVRSDAVHRQAIHEHAYDGGHAQTLDGDYSSPFPRWNALTASLTVG